MKERHEEFTETATGGQTARVLTHLTLKPEMRMSELTDGGWFTGCIDAPESIPAGGSWAARCYCYGITTKRGG